MFHDRSFRRDVDVGFRNPDFYLLPTVKVNISDHFLEVTICLFTFFIYICYSFPKMYEEDES